MRMRKETRVPIYFFTRELESFNIVKNKINDTKIK